MLVSIRPLEDWAGNVIIYIVLRGHNPYPPRTLPANQKQTRPGSTPESPAPAASSIRPSSSTSSGETRAPVRSCRDLSSPGSLASRASPPPRPQRVRAFRREGGSRAAQALIPTGAASSGSRIKRAPAVRSMLERPGEPGARDGDVCVRPGAGEGAGERGYRRAERTGSPGERPGTAGDTE